MKSCSIIVTGKVSVLNFIFNVSVLIYKSFYDLNVMVLIVKPYFIKQAICFIKQASKQTYILNLMVLIC